MSDCGPGRPAGSWVPDRILVIINSSGFVRVVTAPQCVREGEKTKEQAGQVTGKISAPGKNQRDVKVFLLLYYLLFIFIIKL